MKRKLLKVVLGAGLLVKLLSVMSAVGLLVLTACGAGNEGEALVLTLGENHPEAHPVVAGHREFERLVADHTDGAITVDVFPGGVLGGEAAMLEQVQMGATSMMRISAAMLPALDEAFNALFLPYIWDSRESMFAVLDGEVGEYFADRLRAHGLYILAWHDPGARSFYNSVRPVYTPDDLQGLRIRVQETALMMDLIRFLGGSPTPIAWGEVYTAIQTGVVDGAENNWPSFITAAHYEVAQYFTISEHSIIPEPIIINLDIWESMSTVQQETVRQAAIAGAMHQRQVWLEQEIVAMNQAIASGTVVTTLSPEQRQLFTDAVAPMFEQFSHIQDHIDMIRNAQ